jgi:glyoxalase family protein
MQLKGLHHVTAVSGQITQNATFYTQVLGLRLVKKSVNQDDTSAYHLFYADKLGTPGTDITFFDWPHIGPNVPGTNSIAGTAFRVASPQALAFWSERFDQKGVTQEPITEFAGRQLLPFEDPEGQRLYLVDDQGAGFEGEIWDRPDIPQEHALRGFYSVVLTMPSSDPLDSIFQQIMNFEVAEQATWIDQSIPATIYATIKGGGPGTEVWLLEQPEEDPARLGAGGTHHVAFRVKDIEAQQRWRSKIAEAGLPVSQMIDRFWFSSIYFRVSRGILFEIATDGPGFEVDEELDSLGEKLVLPPFLEHRRQEIEQELSPIGV